MKTLRFAAGLKVADGFVTEDSERNGVTYTVSAEPHANGQHIVLVPVTWKHENGASGTTNLLLRRKQVVEVRS